MTSHSTCKSGTRLCFSGAFSTSWACSKEPRRVVIFFFFDRQVISCSNLIFFLSLFRPILFFFTRGGLYILLFSYITRFSARCVCKHALHT
ncbi:uncharacterized protein F4812DRAFT_76065 [Daldinia caldariorum]|uniref:uncharacterized protein n=1 Tax=Daldinia caldariorum TaxID=326644 RepID=UPI002007AB00|nr:uncharacterized protein F4812DRAFT_76065 [Daldinia caldariorum]KAI1466343.1 hypothetical protein F4812DRAFT_76065 [Daldinia caldariorum]